jgi:hypothetical protein
LRIIRQVSGLVRLVGSQCCASRTQAAWERTRDADASADDAGGPL